METQSFYRHRSYNVQNSSIPRSGNLLDYKNIYVKLELLWYKLDLVRAFSHMVSPRDGDHTGTMVASHTSVTLLAVKPLLMQDLHPARSVIEGQHRRTARDTLIFSRFGTH